MIIISSKFVASNINTNVTYTVPDIGADSYNWIIPHGCIYVSGQGTTSITFKTGPFAGNVTLRVSPTNCVGSGIDISKTISITRMLR